MSWIEIATILAIFIGPISAVLVTRYIDGIREDKQRKKDLFTNLMRTRSMKLSIDHVASLNLIQVEFYNDSNVIQKYESYISNLNTPVPQSDQQESFFERREDLFVDLVHSIANALGYQLDKRDLAKLSYGPIGWLHDDDEIRRLRRNANELLEGKRSLPIFTWQMQVGGGEGPFPPPPSQQPTGIEHTQISKDDESSR